MTDEPAPTEEKPPLDPHRCQLCLFWRPNREAIGPNSEDKQCWHPAQTMAWTDDEMPCNINGFIGSNYTEVNVPQHTSKGTMELKNQTPVDGPVEILIVTYSKDFDWLVYALKCVRRHLSGFQGITIAHPVHQSPQFNTLLDQDWGTRVRLHPYQEWLGKGFLQHEYKMACADEIVPAGTKYVLHMDADCMFKVDTTPEDYFYNGKPQYIVRTWDSLSSPDPRDPTQKIVSDCIMWKEPTSRQLGYESDMYTMCRHPTVFPIEFYQLHRTHMEKTHHMSTEDWFRNGQRNSHPQDCQDFCAFGQFCWTFMHDHFHWINCATEEYPADRLRAYHSHSGIQPHVLQEIQSYLT